MVVGPNSRVLVFGPSGTAPCFNSGCASGSRLNQTATVALPALAAIHQSCAIANRACLDMNRRLFALCHERIRHTLVGNVGYLSCCLWCSRHNVFLSVNDLAFIWLWTGTENSLSGKANTIVGLLQRISLVKTGQDPQKTRNLSST